MIQNKKNMKEKLKKAFIKAIDNLDFDEYSYYHYTVKENRWSITIYGDNNWVGVNKMLKENAIITFGSLTEKLSNEEETELFNYFKIKYDQYCLDCQKKSYEKSVKDLDKFLG